MRVLVTGSSGHLGEALARRLRGAGRSALGLDVLPWAFTDVVGSVADRDAVARCLEGVGGVLHAATLHKPHVFTHARREFEGTNVEGTRVLLEEAVRAGVRSFVLVSTTSVFGHALAPPPGAPAVRVTEELAPRPRNVYGETKLAAEALCERVHREHGLPCLVLRTSRFFPEEDDRRATREAYADGNVKANEILYRRVDLEDAAEACLLALERAPALGFGRYVVSATTPFGPEHLPELRRDAPAVVRRLFPDYEDEYARRGWRMFPSIERVYANDRARADLGWRPRYDFRRVLDLLKADQDPCSTLARAVGAKGYHAETFEDGPYPVEE